MHSRTRKFRTLTLLSLLGCALLPGMASAALGEREGSIKVDAARVQGSVKTEERSNYRVHDIQLPSGTRVREFVSRAGDVFAVAWRGPMMPDLRQALGPYFDNYVSASKMKQSNHRHVQIHQNDLVVESSGHMRAFSGRAYLPSAVPNGVSLTDIQ